jgi:aquaporin Z
VVFAGVTMGMFTPSTVWVYLVAQMCAGIAAGFTFRTLNPADK